MIYMFGVVITVYCKFLKHLDLCVCFLNSLQEYGIRGFPTIKVFAPGKPPVDYQGARDVKPIAEFALQQVCWNLLWGVLTFLPKKFMVKYFWHVWVVLHVGVWIEYIRVLFLWQKKTISCTSMKNWMTTNYMRIWSRTWKGDHGNSPVNLCDLLFTAKSFLIIYYAVGVFISGK